VTETQIQEREPSLDRPKRVDGRLAFLDWTRGLAATVMLQGHVFHSFARPDLRESSAWILSQFIGGITPALFLFLTGVTLAFGMDGRERKGVEPAGRLRVALKRAGYLAFLAAAFRIQLWLFAWPQSPVESLLKVDILNCMAISIGALALLAVTTTQNRIHLAAIGGCVIAVASPLVSMWDAAGLPRIAHMYLVPDTNYFSFFPWAAFAAFGVAVGSVLRLITEKQLNRVMQWSAIIGFGLIFTAQYFSNMPYSLYPAADFWINSPGLIFIKLGIILVLLSMGYLWTSFGPGRDWSWMRLLGTTSLLVYWVHIEVVYGRWFGFWKENLSVA